MIAQLAQLAFIAVLSVLLQRQADILPLLGHLTYLQVDVGYFFVDKTFALVILFVQQMHLLVELQCFFPLAL